MMGDILSKYYTNIINQVFVKYTNNVQMSLMLGLNNK